MEIHNRRYLGNKTKLLPFIKEIINQECGEFNSLFDAFSGTGAVASAFLDKKIITNDILYSNYISHIAWFKNEKYNKKNIDKIIEEYNKLSANDITDNYMSENFANTYFNENVCKKIGYIREDIEIKYNNNEINDKERAILITSLLYAMDRIANTCGHYDAWRKGVEFTDNFVLQPLEVFEKTSKKNEFFNMDVNELADSVECDIAYLDPPYNSRQYCDAYHLLENVAKWEKPVVEGVARKMNRDNIKSEYCKKTAVEAFEDLVQKLNCKYIVLSYNNTGDSADSRSNAKITDADIIRILEEKGTVKVFSQSYKAFSTGKSDLSGNEERLFVCKVFEKKTKKDFISSPLNYTGGKTKLLPQISPLFPKNISTFVDLFCGGCNVGINIPADKHIYNDINSYLIGLFQTFKQFSPEQIITEVKKIIAEYNLSDTETYGYKHYNGTGSTGLSSYNKTSYIKLRNDFNNLTNKDNRYYFMFYTLIVYAFNYQIRFNSNGDYNMPVGKYDFNASMQKRMKLFFSTLNKQNSEFTNIRFDQFDISDLDENAFIYADPPYLASTASYNENDGWNEVEEKKLLEFLDKLHSNGIRFALSNAITNNGKTNEILKEWLKEKKDVYHVYHLKFSYSNSNYQRKGNGNTYEVLITNY